MDTWRRTGGEHSFVPADLQRPPGHGTSLMEHLGAQVSLRVWPERALALYTVDTVLQLLVPTPLVII